MHGLCLVACLLIVGLYVWLARRYRETPHRVALERWVGLGCLATWLGNTAFWMWPSWFAWEQALPLHYCNLANVFGAIAVLTRRRLFQALIYFWALALCIWAFLTPTVRMGPLHAQFWIFWLYHLFILLAVAHVLVADQFRPEGRDLRHVMVFTAIYTGVLIVVDYLGGWNYGFVGPSKPESTTLIDALGPYPLRLLWIVLLAAVALSLCYLPWYAARAWRRRRNAP